MIHQVTPAAQPPVMKYTGAHSVPNSSPKVADRMAQPRGLVIPRSSHAATAKTSQMYR